MTSNIRELWTATFCRRAVNQYQVKDRKRSPKSSAEVRDGFSLKMRKPYFPFPAILQSSGELRPRIVTVTAFPKGEENGPDKGAQGRGFRDSQVLGFGHESSFRYTKEFNRRSRRHSAAKLVDRMEEVPQTSPPPQAPPRHSPRQRF
jgi:hypothetical protein